MELLGGRGEDLWPPPGRMMAVGPAHTFADLATAIDDAFARWDRAHLCRFGLADGRIVTDEESGADFGASPFGPLARPMLVLERAKVLRTVALGEEFSYTFDFGDDWIHRCVVEEAKVDPLDVLGIAPRKPLPYWGWGAIPDQYGRRWDEDTGEEQPPQRPDRPDPMLFGGWPEVVPAEPVDHAELRGATFRGDVPAILAALDGRDIDDCLQHVGAAVQVLLDADEERAPEIAVSVVGRLEDRGDPGDEILAEDLLALLRGEEVAARILAVDLAELAYELGGDVNQPAGYLDLHTGEVVPASLTDPAEVGEDEAIDLEEDLERWLPLERLGSRDGWRDMADFADGVRSQSVQRRLQSAIEGRGAFRRFRDVIGEEGLVAAWRRFADDREIGRARDYLDGHEIRVRPQLKGPSPTSTN